MARTVIVYRAGTFDEPPTEIVRATLNPDNTVTLLGLDPHQLAMVEEQGIKDWAEDEYVPLTDGTRFLDVLLRECAGPALSAVECQE